MSGLTFVFMNKEVMKQSHLLYVNTILFLLGADTTNEMTVLQAESEGFVLEPVEIVQKGKKSRRKRKLIVDDEKILSTDSIKAQLADTTDIVKHATLAPPTKKRMKHKVKSNLDQLFTEPCVEVLANPILEIITENLTKTIASVEYESKEEQKDDKMEINTAEEDTSQETPEPADKSRKSLSVTFEEPLPEIEEQPFLQDDMMVSQFEPEEKEEENQAIDLPASQVDEEKLNSETEEQFENRRWTKRTNQLLHTLKREFTKKQSVDFNGLVQKNSRKQAAYKFYSCLLLSKDNTLTMSQKDLFGSIVVKKGEHFAAAC